MNRQRLEKLPKDSQEYNRIIQQGATTIDASFDFFKFSLTNVIIPMYVQRKDNSWIPVNALLAPDFEENVILDYIGSNHEHISAAVKIHAVWKPNASNNLLKFGYQNYEVAAGYAEFDSTEIPLILQIDIGVEDAYDLEKGKFINTQHFHVVNRENIRRSSFSRTARSTPEIIPQRPEGEIFQGWDLVIGSQTADYLMDIALMHPNNAMATCWPEKFEKGSQLDEQLRVDWIFTQAQREEHIRLTQAVNDRMINKH